MKKTWLLLAIIFCAAFVAAANETTTTVPDNTDDKVQKAYACLAGEIGNKSLSSISLQEAFFGTYALGSNNKLKEKIDSEKSAADCWPKSSCRLKETAQGLMAYYQLGKDTEDIEEYLLTKNGSTTDLTWFLVIDVPSRVQATCTIKDGSGTSTVTIGEDMKVSGSPGSCFSIIPSGFWLQVQSGCLERKFEISCNRDFVTTLHYRQGTSETIFVSADTHSAASSGTTTEQINAKCFKSGGSCDYEGTLWSALALQLVGKDVSAYVPYLLALAPENQKLLPESFIYKISSSEDQYSLLVQSQKQGKYWEAPATQYNKFYDTSLAMLALQGRSSIELDNAKSYLLSIQTPKGCWNNDNIRDTAFILYAGWPSIVPRVPASEGGGSVEQCSTAGFFCQSSVFACSEAGGQILNNYVCPGVQKCCSLSVRETQCSVLGGTVCTIDEACSESELPSADGSCCLGQCNLIGSSANQCESSGGTCASSCSSGEFESTESCTLASDVCCVQSLEETPSEGGFSWWIIIVLVILIAIIALAIIFRKKLQLLLFKFRKGKVSSSPVVQRRPPFPPSAPPRQVPSRVAPARRQTNDKEMDEVLRKLKDISK